MVLEKEGDVLGSWEGSEIFFGSGRLRIMLVMRYSNSFLGYACHGEYLSACLLFQFCCGCLAREDRQ